MTAEERERQTRKESLQLSRSRTLGLIETTRSERYRAQLQRTLEHLEAQLRELEKDGMAE